MSEETPPQKLPRPPWLRLTLIGLAASVCVNGGLLLASVLEVSPVPVLGLVASFIKMPLFAVLLAGLVVGVAWILASPALMVSQRLRSWGAGIFFAAVVFLAPIYFVLWALTAHRTRAFAKLAERSMPLVAAIHRYYDDHGKPPIQLTQLVPDYIDAIPGTQMSGYPGYSYSALHLHSDAAGNPWELWVNTPNGVLDFDRFVYFPNQNYPERGESGFYERIGDWAYYHE